MKTPFKKTVKRSKILLAWLIEEKEEIKKLEKQRLKILDSQDLLYINSENYKQSKEMVTFCTENIVSHHLSNEELKVFNSFKKQEKDNTNYMM